VYLPLTIFFLLDFVHRRIFQQAWRVGGLLCFCIQVKNAPTLVDLSDKDILCH
jgi:hypothetical protein